MSMPAVTVIITAYNLEKYISRCLDDLLCQTMPDFDILIIDDHSSDATGAIVRDYLARYPNIQALFLPENLGSSARARNAALNSGLIAGEYAVFLDGDDRIEPDYLECLFTAATAHHADIAVCAFDRVDAASGRRICAELQWLPDGGTLAGGDTAIAFLNGAIWNKMIRVGIIGNERIPDLKIGEDVSFALKLYNRCDTIACVRRNLIHYQVRPGSAIAGTDIESIQQFADELAGQYNIAPEKARPALLLTAYLHIALSMMMRAAEHADINLREHYRWTIDYCRLNFDHFAGIKPYMFCRHTRRKLKGAAIYLSFVCYRHGLLLPAIRMLRLYTRVTGKDIKW
jgi:glycosyltransferase involved in cell wall biosynthesis